MTLRPRVLRHGNDSPRCAVVRDAARPVLLGDANMNPSHPQQSVQSVGIKDDPRAAKVVAKSIYRELIDGGFREADVMSVAGELLALVASGVRARRDDEQDETGAS